MRRIGVECLQNAFSLADEGYPAGLLGAPKAHNYMATSPSSLNDWPHAAICLMGGAHPSFCSSQLLPVSRAPIFSPVERVLPGEPQQVVCPAGVAVPLRIPHRCLLTLRHPRILHAHVLPQAKKHLKCVVNVW